MELFYLKKIDDIHFLKILGVWLKEYFTALAVCLECIPFIALEGDCTVICNMQY
jgi:hypothetical protein